MTTSAILAWDVGVKNLSFCVYARDHTILAWDDLDTSIRRGTSLSQTVQKFTQFLDSFCASERFTNLRGSITHCVIENQPKRNPTMRVVSGILGTYFFIKFGWAPVYYNPAHKLASVDLDQAFEFGKSRRRKGRWGSKEAGNAYRMRKRASIEETRRLLQTDTRFREWLVFFERHRKKDDLGDTFLMARAFLHAPPVEVEDDSSDDSSSSEDGEEAFQTEAEAGTGSDCPLRTFMRAHPTPGKSKTAPSESVEHFKFCLEERLHKEYGTGKTLQSCVDHIVKKSKAKGIQDFRTNLNCTCGQCEWIEWILHEPHWKTMFRA